MQFQITAPSRAPRIETFQIVESGVPVNAAPTTGPYVSTAAIMPEGWTRGNVSEQAANVYTLVFAQPFARAPVFQVTAVQSGTGVSLIPNIVSTAADRISWRVENDASVGAAPTGFHVTVMGYDTADLL